jgi:amidase
MQSMVDIACIGPLARSAGDLALAFDVLAGPDPLDTAAPLRLPPPPRGPQGLRVAIWAEDAATHTDADVTRAVLAAGRALRRAGAKVSTTARPPVDAAAAFTVYLRLLGAVLFSRMTPEAHAPLADAAARLTESDRSADDEMLRAVKLSHGAWLGLHEQRNRMRRAWGAFFRDWDVLICPAHAVPAQPHQQGVATHDMRVTINGTTQRWNSMLFWPGVIGGMLLPATAAPLGVGREGLPIGCQIVGPMHGDRTTLAVAALLEKLVGGFVAPPGWRDPDRTRA